MKRKAIIYPYNILASQIVRYREFIHDFEILKIVSPRGLGLNGKDAGDVDEGEKTGVLVTENFEDALLICDTVIVPEYDLSYNLRFTNILIDKIMFAMKNGKNICCLHKFPDKIMDFLIYYACQNKVCFEIFDDNKNIHNINDTCFPVTPIIGVWGISEYCSKFELQMSLYKQLLKKGYRISMITSKNYGELFGAYSFPNFMFSNICEIDKIYRFRCFVKDIEEKDHPDLMIIGIPGGIVPINRYNTNYFGVLPFEISNSVSFDYNILSIMPNRNMDDLFSFIEGAFRFRFGTRIDSYYVSNIRINEESLVEQSGSILSYDVLPHKRVEKIMRQYKSSANIFLDLGKQNRDLLVTHIEKSLSTIY